MQDTRALSVQLFLNPLGWSLHGYQFWQGGKLRSEKGKWLQTPVRKPWDFRVSEDSLRTPEPWMPSKPIVWRWWNNTKSKEVAMNLDTRGMPNPGHCQQGRWGLLLLSKEVRLQLQGFDARNQQMNLEITSCIRSHHSAHRHHCATWINVAGTEALLRSSWLLIEGDLRHSRAPFHLTAVSASCWCFQSHAYPEFIMKWNHKPCTSKKKASFLYFSTSHGGKG